MRVCTVCKHPQRERIEEALLRNVPLRTIAHDLQTSSAAVYRHKQHLDQKLLIAEHVKEVTEATSLLERVEALIKDCAGIAAAAKAEKAWPAATGALREVRGCLELLARLSGELQAAASVQFHTHAHLHTGATVPTDDRDLEIEIARQVSEATCGFDPREIARLQSLLSAQPMVLEVVSTSGIEPNVPMQSIE